MEKKICRVCDVEKELMEFELSRGYRGSQCKECKSNAVKKSYTDNPEKIAKRRETTKQWKLKLKANQ